MFRRTGAEGPAYSIAGRARPEANAQQASAAAVPGPGKGITVSMVLLMFCRVLVPYRCRTALELTVLAMVWRLSRHQCWKSCFCCPIEDSTASMYMPGIV